MNRYLIVIENAGRNYSAYSPDLPGCASTGTTIEETQRNMEARWSFTSKDFAKTVFQFRRPRRSRGTSRTR